MFHFTVPLTVEFASVFFLVADVCVTPDNEVSDGRTSSQMQFATNGFAQTSATKKALVCTTLP
jgi:hypothetical protein